jgi:hypothetical protein
MKDGYVIKRYYNKRVTPTLQACFGGLALLFVVLIAAAIPSHKSAASTTPSQPAQVNKFASNCEPEKQTAETNVRSVTVDFDSIDVSFGRLMASLYLPKFGISVKDVTDGTRVVIVDTRTLYGGAATVASSKPNVLTQISSNDPVSFTLEFDTPLKTVRFTRPVLVSGPTGITFPEWGAEALDSEGRRLGEPVGEPLGAGLEYYTIVPAKRCTLNGPAIKSVRFYSNNHHFAAFNAVLVDDLTLIQ